MLSQNFELIINKDKMVVNKNKPITNGSFKKRWLMYANAADKQTKTVKAKYILICLL